MRSQPSRTKCGGPVLIAVLVLAFVVSLPAHGRGQTLDGRLSLLGQVREGDQTRETEAPTDIYGDLSLRGLTHGSRADTFFRLERDFGIDDGASDFYAGFLRVPDAVPGLDMTLGRQFLSEGPGGAFVADAGKVCFDPGWPVAVTIFGGAPRYFEPTYSSEIISQDEIMFGGKIQTTRWNGTHLSLGYLQLERADQEIRQLINGTASRIFHTLPGLPNAYSSFAFDADHQNLDQFTAGTDLFLSQPRLLLNLEGTYYQPQDHGDDEITLDLDRREDAIFELFSVSEMLQFRGGLRYVLTPSLSWFGDYSYQRYEELDSNNVNGHVGSTGLLWLPGGDGLEIVRLEYYVLDSKGGNANGGKIYYESRVYERLLFHTKLDVTYYEKRSNQEDTAVNGFVGLGFLFMPDLLGELNLEANHNERFDSDIRFGFLITYNFRHAMRRSEREREAS